MPFQRPAPKPKRGRFERRPEDFSLALVPAYNPSAEPSSHYDMTDKESPYEGAPNICLTTAEARFWYPTPEEVKARQDQAEHFKNRSDYLLGNF